MQVEQRRSNVNQQLELHHHCSGRSGPDGNINSSSTSFSICLSHQTALPSAGAYLTRELLVEMGEDGFDRIEAIED